MAAVGAYPMPTRHSYASPGYGAQSPQAAAAVMTAAMMQAAHAPAQVPKMQSFQQAANPNYQQQSMANGMQTPYSAQSFASSSREQQSSFAMQMQMSAPQWDFQKPQIQAPEGPPQSLTEGMADPVAIDRQKAGYVKTLEEQRLHYINALDAQKKEYLDSIHGQADQLKKQMLMQLNQQVKEQTNALENKYNEQVMTLNEQFHSQRAFLEQETIKLKGEYQQKLLEEQAMHRQFQLQRERVECEQKYAADMQQLKQQQYQMAQQAGMYGQPGMSHPPHGSSSYAEAPQAQGGGSYVPPITMHAQQQGSYVPPPNSDWATSQGSYVPPATTFQAQSSSYVPPCGGNGSYVPPVTMFHEQQCSYAPPASGSYVPPCQGSYLPPCVDSYTPPATTYALQSSSYVPSPTSAELLRCAPQGAITQPQAPVYHGQGAQQAPQSTLTNYSCAQTVHSQVMTTPIVSYS